MDHQGRKIIIIALAAIFLSLIPVYAKEQTEIGFSVEPAILNLEVSRGVKIEKIIKIKNIGNAPAAATINLRDLSFAGLNAKDERRAALARWIVIENYYFILNPGETEEIPIHLSVPETAEYRSYWSFLTIEPQVANGREGSVRAAAMVGIPLLLAVVPEGGGRIASGGLVIAGIELRDAARVKFLERFFNQILNIRTSLAGQSEGGSGNLVIIEKDPYDFNIKLKNIGDYHYNTRGSIGLFDGKDRLVASANVDTETILPGEEKNYPLKMAADNLAIFPGKYRADINLLAYAGGRETGREIKNSLEFWFFPWKKILFYALLILLFFPSIFILVFHRKRFIFAVRVLFGEKKLRAADYKVDKETDEIKNLFILNKK